MPPPSKLQQGAGTAKGYVPALGYHGLTGLYDHVVAVTMREATWRADLVKLIAPRAGERILDVGCGTGSLAVALAQVEPGAQITGIDPDAAMLEVARKRATAAGVTVELVGDLAQRAARAGALAGRRFDKIVSSLVFHHLDDGAKRTVLATMQRLLALPNGQLIILDWGAMPGILTRLRFLPVQLLDGFDSTRANVAGRMPQLLTEAGFRVIATPWTFETAFGPLATWIAEANGSIASADKGGES
jgi:ubiquinone/menaquinone biosynthesis C-methylase UbiE